jgi:hypothetical protein
VTNPPPAPPSGPTPNVPPNKPTPQSQGGGTGAKGVPERLVSDLAPDPDLSTDGAAYKEYEAYGALAALAADIADTVWEPVERGGVLLVQDTAGIAALATYREFRDRTAMLAQAYDLVAPATDAARATKVPAPAAAMGTALKGAVLGAGEILGGVADIVALFKPQRRISSRTFTASDESLAAEVSGNLARRANPRDPTGAKLRVYYPPLFPPEVARSGVALTEIGAALAHVARARHQAEDRIAQLDAQDQPPARERLHELDKRASMLEASLLGGTAGEPDPTSPDNHTATDDAHLISQLVRGASRQQLLGETGHLLFVKLVRLGGIEHEIERRLGRDKDLYRGMAVATFFLLRADGTLVNARTERRLSQLIDRRD